MAEDKHEKPKEAGEGEAEAGAAGAENAKGSKKKLIIIGVIALVVLIGAGAGIFFGVIKGHGTPKEAAPVEEKVSTDKHATDSRRGKKRPGETPGPGENEKEAKTPEGKPGEAAAPVDGQPIYLDLQEFLVNLNTSGKQTSFLKLVVTLDIPDMEAKQAVEANMPRIRDSFQVYLRELRTEDLHGSAGLQLLREELLLRINKIITPAKIDDILFKEVIVQ